MQHLIINLRERKLDREDEGFTLIEMAIVIAVIAILIAVALPTFLGVQNSAHRSATVQQITNSLTGAKSFYGTNSSAYTGINMKALEPTITYDNVAPGPPPVTCTAPAGIGQGGVSCLIPDSQMIVFTGFDTGKNVCITAVDTYPASTNLANLPGASAGVYWSTDAIAPVASKCTAIAPPAGKTWTTTPPKG